MIINKIESYIFLYKVKNHFFIKDKILKFIDSQPERNHVGKSENLSKFDYEVIQKKYGSILFDNIQEYFEEFKKLFICNKITIHNYWYQQYIKNNFHSWHAHGGSNFSAIYYVELNNNKYQTEFFDTIKKSYINIGEVKEGDILTFPSYLIHRSKKIEENERKTIFSFNFSIEQTEEEYLNNV